MDLSFGQSCKTLVTLVTQSHNTPYLLIILLPFMVRKSKEYNRSWKYRVVTSDVTSVLYPFISSQPKNMENVWKVYGKGV